MIKNLQQELSQTASSLGSTALDLAEERRLRLELEKRNNITEQKLAYYESRSRHFEFHTRSLLTRLRSRRSNTISNFVNYPSYHEQSTPMTRPASRQRISLSGSCTNDPTHYTVDRGSTPEVHQWSGSDLDAAIEFPAPPDFA